MLQENTIPSAPPRMNEMKSYRTRGKGFRLALRVLIILLVVGLVGVGGFFALSHLGLLNTSSGSNASITSSIVDDLAAHTVLIPGEDGQQIYVGAPMQATYPWWTASRRLRFRITSGIATCRASVWKTRRCM